MLKPRTSYEELQRDLRILRDWMMAGDTYHVNEN